LNGRRTEFAHNTPEQVREYLREALDVVDELGPPDDLRAACFTKAADLIAAKQITVEAVAPFGGGLAVPRGL
jgi:hypothetical protein